MEKEDIAKKVLEEIKCKKICPTARWFFVCKNYSFWAITTLSVIIVSLALSLMIFIFFSNDWDVYQLESGNIVRHILVYTPYLWIIIFLLFTLLAIYGINKTKYGYKYENCKCGLPFGLLILLIALILIFAGISSVLEDIAHRMPAYNFMIADKHNIWDNPSKGLLAGQVTQIIDKNNFDIKDFSQDIWHVQEQNTKMVPPNFKLAPNKKIKMIGRLCLPCPEKNTFIVTEIKPW